MTTSLLSKQNLTDEASYFVKIFFNKDIDNKTVERYIGANEKIFFSEPKLELQNDFIMKMIEKKADIEALEFAWRIVDKNNILSKKIHVIFYILESRSEYVPFFVNRNTAFIKGSLFLLVSLFRSAYKYIKGRILLKRYHIV